MNANDACADLLTRFGKRRARKVAALGHWQRPECRGSVRVAGERSERGERQTQTEEL
jgi:hypothetical protein